MAGSVNRNARRRAGSRGELAAAVGHHQAGRLRQAADGYRNVLRQEPGNGDALHLLGVIALAEGRPRQAIRLIREALAAVPNFAEAHSNLGNAYRAAGRREEAHASYRRALALDPDCASAHNNLGLLLCEKGDCAAALGHCRRAVELAPNLAEAHNNLGNAQRGLGQFEAAAEAFRRALQLEPSAARQTNLANVLADLGHFAEAEAAYRRAIALDRRFASAHHGLGAQLRRRGEVAEAVKSFAEAVALSPRHAVAWNDLGQALRALGNIEEAIGAFRRAIAIDPEMADAYRNLAACRRLEVREKDLSRLRGLAARLDLPIEQRAAAGFAIGKAFDDADRFDEAFAAYEQANRLYRDARAMAGDRFDATLLQHEVDEAIARYGPDYFASVADWGSASELPVFIVGMPRSGTSLVEQIAASHSCVFGAGELREIGELAVEFGRAPEAADVRRLAEAHLARLRALGGGAERVIDKMPDNVFKLGVIATLFPGARIIFCRRDPRDTCLSCYFQKFTAGQLTFSYDLADCAMRYRETERLREHWRRALPLRSIEVQYEALVGDLEGESRRLIDFLGLDWEPACLDFHRTQRIVTTASGWQVRQPLYDRSVARWRHYQRHLEPLSAALAAAEAGPAAR